jgi:hypothetical protein
MLANGVMLRPAPADHGGDRLVVGRRRLRSGAADSGPGPGADGRLGRGLGSRLPIGRCLGVLAQVGGEYLHDWPVQVGRVLSDLLQRVDSSDADVELVVRPSAKRAISR